MSTLIVCCTIAFCALCLMIYNVKKVSADVYKRIVIDDTLPKSPYSLIRTKNSAGYMGYSITKDGKIMYIPGTGDTRYEVHTEIRTAIYHINVMEKIEGFRLTTVE